jgi:hypothetical protein
MVLGALEHEVLEEVREAGATRPLVLGSDVIPKVYRHDRYVAVLMDDDIQAVGERAFGVGKRERIHAATAPG